MSGFQTSELDAFVAMAQKHGLNWDDPEMRSRYGDYRLKFESVVDSSLSPYSPEYFDQQLRLYSEIAGRPLDQASGELHEVDVEALVGGANPKGVQDVGDVGENSRCMLNMLALTGLRGSPKVLDLGAGHGVSSEILAYAGCQVHAVDIDPALGELSRRRAAARGFALTRTDASYDDLANLPKQAYAAAFFFQSLHHCLTPWRLIETLRLSLLDDGVIAFAGEPLQSEWWPHWGLRLDPESIYVARRYGWFESGWSHDFLADCFARAGMRLDFFNGGNGGGEIGVATPGEERRASVRATAVTLGLRCLTDGPPVAETRFATLTGVRRDLGGRPGFQQTAGGDSYLLYGPYTQLDAGDHRISLQVRDLRRGLGPGALKIDCVTTGERELRPSLTIHSDDAASTDRLVTFDIALPQLTKGVEVRAKHTGSAFWHVSLPTFERLERKSPGL